MREDQIKLVKKTWRLLRELDPLLLGDVFYSRLFVSHPELQALFKGPMTVQYEKLLNMLGYVVSHLDRLEELADEVAALGERHVQYGVRPEHYASVGEALLWTLETGLGRDWNEDVAQGWATFYNLIAQKMQVPIRQQQLNQAR